MFEKAKAKLQEKDENGNCVFDHLVSVIENVLQSDENGYDNIEHFSALIKQKKTTTPKIDFDKCEVKEMESYIASTLELSGKPGPPPVVADDEEAPEEVVVDPSKVADIMNFTQLFQWCGIDLEEDWWQLQCSCMSLAKQFPLIAEPRFFGKIFGIENDYFVVEAKLESHEPMEDMPEMMEMPGVGVNEFVYFVCNDLTRSQWVQLPFVTPSQIKQSRECRVQVRGVLTAPIGGRLAFSGDEAVYLRCIIARIVSDTLLCPQGYYTQNEESENPIEINKSEEFAMPEDMGALGNWVHGRGHLRKEGRLTKFVKQVEDGEEAEEAESNPDAEEEVKILHSAESDETSVFQAGEDEHPLWVTRKPNGLIKSSYQVFEIRNKAWPGALTAFEQSSQTFANIYVGDGVQFLNAPYVPQPVAPIMKEFNEYPEMQDPENPDEMIQSPDSMFKEAEDVRPPEPEPEAVPEETAEENAEAAEEVPEPAES